MDYSIIQQGDTIQNGLMEVACNYLTDILKLPTDWVPGSTCIVIENSSVWMLGVDRQWYEI